MRVFPGWSVEAALVDQCKFMWHFAGCLRWVPGRVRAGRAGIRKSFFF